MDKWRRAAFICCHWAYMRALERPLGSDPNYERCVADFDEVPGEFFRLGDELGERPKSKLGKKKKNHRWGFLTLLMKFKNYEKIRTGQIACWEQLTFRPILSYYQNIWQRWYTMTGNVLTLMAKTTYVQGDAVTSMEEVQHKVARFHAKYEDEDQDI